MSEASASAASKGSKWEREAAARLPALLSDWLGEPVVRVVSAGVHDNVEFAVAATTSRRVFMVEVKGSDSIAGLERAAAQLLQLPRVAGQVPLLVVPYMGPQARAWARSKQVSWADLSGNADIRAPNLRVFVEGNANRYAQSGRPANPFAPKYARVSRVLLTDADRWWRQRDLCVETALSDATVSRAVGHLESADLLETNSEGAVRARAPSVLLDAWAQRYSFADHRVHKFQTVARTGHAALQSLATKLSGTSTTWAATGLSAAYMWTRFADFRLTALFVDELPHDTESLGLHPVERGENVWLVVPRDEGVFYKKSQQGVWCVPPVQVYLDLLSQPERAREAASHLRAELLQWRA
jgi:hypothetical protein